jgi:hypothetical protein
VSSKSGAGQIEKYFINEFQTLFKSEHVPAEDQLYLDPVAIRHDDEVWTIEIRGYPKRSRPF